MRCGMNRTVNRTVNRPMSRTVNRTARCTMKHTMNRKARCTMKHAMNRPMSRRSGEVRLWASFLGLVQWGFPVVAVVLLVTLLAWPQLRSLGANFSDLNPLDDEESLLSGRAYAEAEGIILEGKSASEIGFRLYAERAEARVTTSLALTEYERESAGGDEEDLLLLSDVRLIWGTGAPLELRADEAQHSPTERVTRFAGNVVLTSESDATRLQASQGQADWRVGEMVLTGPVRGKNRDGQLRAAEGVRVFGSPNDGASRLVLLGKTRVELIP